MVEYFENLQERGISISYEIMEFFRNSKDYKQYIKEKKK